VGFQDSSTPIMEGVVDLHNHIFFYAVLIILFVCKLFYDIVSEHGFFMFNLRDFPEGVNDVRLIKESFLINNVGSSISHNTLIEVVWTIVPTLILISIAIPSFILLYSMDEVNSPGFTIKAIGHQWYWSYEYSDHSNTDSDISFDSYMVPLEELDEGDVRLLTVDSEIVVPSNIHFRVIITATDVLHSWSVNSLGVKMDAVPGRLSQVTCFIKREGVYYGQCSELCGVNHGFMPITVRAVDLNEYINWFIVEKQS
jgi:cytochrome c oxidase subunit 2